MPKPSGWFFDSVSLSNFALTEHLDILRARYGGRLFLTMEVVDELALGVSSGYRGLAKCLQLVERGVFRAVGLSGPERKAFVRLIAHLGRGEAATIAAASQRRGIVVTDDLAARRTCEEIEAPFTGTLGILQASVRDGTLALDAANAILTEMIRAGFHSPVNRLTEH